jgi:hypothetical protein
MAYVSSAIGATGFATLPYESAYFILRESRIIILAYEYATNAPPLFSTSKRTGGGGIEIAP